VKIRDVMTPDIEVVIPEETLSTAAQLMAECDLDALPVSDNNRLIGTITGRDIAMRVVQEGCDPKEVRVGQAMTGDVLYCFAGESIADVAQKMAEWWVPRLPVVNQDRRPVGIVSLGELIALKPLPQARQARTPEHKLQRARSARQMRPPSKGGGCGVTAISWADPNRRFQSLALRVHASGAGSGYKIFVCWAARLTR
jgi:CBS domain-containing protein